MGSRSQITSSDQGHSFQAFYEFLLSDARQEELTERLRQVVGLDAVEVDPRMRGIHHDWSEAAERAQRTVRQISEQLRRFLDDQVWMENRRVLDLVREVEAADDIFEALLTDQQRILGPDHPDTPRTRNNLSSLLDRSGP